MYDFNNMKGFEAISNFTVNKSFQIETVGGGKISIEKIPVLIGVGARFSENFSERKEDFFSFHPYGVISPGEKNIITREEMKYLLETKMIKLIF